MGRSRGFGSIQCNYSPFEDSLSLRLLRLKRINLATLNKSPDHSAKGTPSPIEFTLAGSLHRAPTACKYTVSDTISLPSQGFFSPFPHGTSSLSDAREYLVLARGRAGFARNFTCSALLGNSAEEADIFSLTGLSPSMVSLSREFS